MVGRKCFNMTTIIVLAVVLTVSVVANAVLIGVLVGTRIKLRKSNRMHSYGRICGHERDI